jgi:hypothetical protein
MRQAPSTTAPSRTAGFLTRLATLLLIGMLAFSAFLVVGAVAGLGPNGHEVRVHTQVDTGRIAGLPHDAIVPDHVDAIVRIRHATAADIRWAAARDLAPGLVLIAGLWILRGVLSSVRDRDPFDADNVRRLRRLGFLVLVGVPIATTMASYFQSELADRAGYDGRGLVLSVPGGAFLAGLALLALAEVFATGVRMRVDLEGTV